jgi:hypothetical protein
MTTDTTHTTITVKTPRGPIPLAGLPTSCPGLVIVPVLDTDDEDGHLIYTDLWTLHHAVTGKAVVGHPLVARNSTDAAYALAGQLGQLDLDWTSPDAGTTWPAEVRQQIKALFLESDR